ncbi:MAG: ASPIC/UnbV domain-containing protein [Planctomycetes bacterium]|nr:ASPIC/UnbV domain-containing protein [Planctomycetota bacterium]
MTSQSPAEQTEAPDDYKQAWASIQHMVFFEGMSWSGREQNRLFLNLGNMEFADVSSVGTIDFAGDGRAAAVVDWDDDGRLDLVLKNRTAPRLQVLRNLASGGGAWLKLDLVGTAGNRDAVGARATVEAGGVRQGRTVYAGEGYLAQSSKRLHFGLGAAESVDAVTVRWPNGDRERFTGLEPSRRYRLVQGSGAPAAVEARPAAAFDRPPPAAPRLNASGVSRIALVEKLPIPYLEIPAFAKQDRYVGDLQGRPVLLNLWGNTCQNCLVEFAGFQQAKAAIDASGLRLVTLNTDPADQHERARSILARFGLDDADAGYADEQFLTAFEVLLREVVGGNFGTPLPTSLLLDSAGSLVAVYRGRVEPEVLLRDVELLKRMDPADPSDTKLSFGGRVFRKTRDYASLVEQFEQLGLSEMAGFYRQGMQAQQGGGR